MTAKLSVFIEYMIDIAMKLISLGYIVHAVTPYRGASCKIQHNKTMIMQDKIIIYKWDEEAE